MSQAAQQPAAAFDPGPPKPEDVAAAGAGSLSASVQSLSESGRYGEALARVAGELARRPGDGELLFARATVWFDWGRLREAYTGFLQAEAAGVSRTALYLNMAWSCHLLRMSDDAERHARRAIAGDSASVAAHFGLGAVLSRLKRFPDAVAAYQRVLELAPDHAQAVAGIAQCRLEQHDYADAETWMRRAVALSPDSPQFRINLAVAIANQQRYEESLEVLRGAAELEAAQGAPPLSITDTGFALVSMGRYAEAFDVFARGLPVFPDPRAHGYYAFLLLVMGRLREGWIQYEFRWMQDPHLSRRPVCPQPPWAGQDLAGKTLLVLDEQGAGDIIHFARFVRLLKAKGARVILLVRPEIAHLAAEFAGVDQVYSRPDMPSEFDYHIHLMSIPHVLGIGLDNIPADVPYVNVDAAKSLAWAGRIQGSGLKVGLVWAGNPKYPRDNFRSIALEKLNGLFNVEGVSFYSLQKPLKEGELEKFPTQTTMVNLDSELTDFTQTAAAIDRLDLVICVDTAIAHLSGALGKPTWLMLPEIGDFRWLEGRDDNPWYPTMRLFRQRKLGEWDEVVARVRSALEAAVNGGSILPPTTTGGPDGVPPAPRDAEPAVAKDIARVVETRHGILQYLPDADCAARSIAWYGEYLEPQLKLLARLVPKGSHVVEAGSGIGDHAIALAKLVGPEGHLLVYETRPVVQQILRQNLEANRVSGTITMMRRGLGAPRDLPRGDGDAGDMVVDTLDALLLDKLELLKLRHDAPVADILDGASATLWRLRPLLLIDAGDADALAASAARVREFGYRCWRMETPLFDSANYNRRDTDIFGSGVALALLGIPEEVNVPEALEGCVELTGEIARQVVDSAWPDAAGRDAATDVPSATAGDATGLLRFLRKLIR